MTLNGDGIVEDRVSDAAIFAACADNGEGFLMEATAGSYMRELERFGGTKTSFSSDGPNLACWKTSELR